MSCKFESFAGEESQEELGSKSWQNNPISSVWGTGGRGQGAGSSTMLYRTDTIICPRREF